MRHKITLISIIALLGSITLGTWVYKSNQKRINSVVLVQHTIEVSYQTAKIGAFETQLKTLLITYQKTKDTSLLQPIAITQRKLLSELNHLIYLTSDNKMQYQRAILLKKDGQTLLQSPINKINSPIIKKSSLQLTQMLNLIQQEEERLLVVRKIGRAHV